MWDGKKQTKKKKTAKKKKKKSAFNTTDSKLRTKFLRIYVKSHNTYIVTSYYLA